MRKIEVIPSLLSMDLSCIKSELKKIPDSVNMLHLDVMDGHFVDNITFGPVVLRSIRKNTKKLIDAHLMISEPERYYDRFILEGADFISFHQETADNPLKLIKGIKGNGAKAGIAINPETEAGECEKLLKHLDYVLIMSVHPGFAGQTFIYEALEKISYLNTIRKKRGYDFAIEIDGGINGETAKDAIASGADWIVTGSYLFQNGNIKRKIERMIYDA